MTPPTYWMRILMKRSRLHKTPQTQIYTNRLFATRNKSGPLNAGSQLHLPCGKTIGIGDSVGGDAHNYTWIRSNTCIKKVVQYVMQMQWTLRVVWYRIQFYMYARRAIAL